MEILLAFIRFVCLIAGLIMIVMGLDADPRDMALIIPGCVLAAIGGFWILIVDFD